MPNYCVNKNAQSGSRDHEVHDLASTKNCLPLESNRVSLGNHPSCREAVAASKRFHYSDSNGCRYCAPACHTT